MKSEMANKLEELLAQMPQGQFEREWSEIENLGMKGPSFDEMLSFFELTQSSTGSYEVKADCSVYVSSRNKNIALAA